MSYSPNCVNSQIKDDKHFIEPILFTGSTDETKTQILKALDEYKNANAVVVENNYIRAEFVSSLFRFVDDVEFYFPKTEVKETTIHIRSASRIGYSDLGTNRKRIEQFRCFLK